MMRGERVALRARHEDDGPVLQAELYDDVANQAEADSRPWRPISPGSPAAPYRIKDPTDQAAAFSVVELSSQELAGEAVLWGIDVHNRCGHLGLALRPSFRGRGLGTDVVRVLCDYGFTVRGLHRLQIETLARNDAMIRAATSAGFTQEGTLRAAAWVMGEFVDEVVFGRLAEQ